MVGIPRFQYIFLGLLEDRLLDHHGDRSSNSGSFEDRCLLEDHLHQTALFDSYPTNCFNSHNYSLLGLFPINLYLLVVDLDCSQAIPGSLSLSDHSHFD